MNAPLNAPVKYERRGNRITITAFIRFKGNYAGKRLDAENNTGYTYAELAASSIESKWSGSYKFYGQEFYVTVKVFCDKESTKPALNPNKVLKPAKGSKDQGFLAIKISGYTIASWIMRSHERLSWLGTIKNNETITSWSLEKSSTPIMIYVTQNFQSSDRYKLIGRSGFEGLVAHEFGHALGLGDAYNAGYRGGKFPWTLDGFYAPSSYEIRDAEGKSHTVTVPINDMMLSHGKVTDNDMRMVYEAYETGKQQLFPLGSRELDKR